MINNLKQMASSFFQILTFSLPEPFYREGSDKKVSNQVSANFFANRAFLSSAFQGNGTFIHAKEGDTALICFPFSVINVRVISWCHCWLIY